MCAQSAQSAQLRAELPTQTRLGARIIAGMDTTSPFAPPATPPTPHLRPRGNLLLLLVGLPLAATIALHLYTVSRWCALPPGHPGESIDDQVHAWQTCGLMLAPSILVAPLALAFALAAARRRLWTLTTTSVLVLLAELPVVGLLYLFCHIRPHWD